MNRACKFAELMREHYFEEIKAKQPFNMVVVEKPEADE